MITSEEMIKVFNQLNEDDRSFILNEAIKKIDIYNLTDLEEAGGVTVVKENNLYIAIQPDQGREFYKDAYFKISWQSNFNDNNKVARISMRTTEKHKYPRYIYHNNSDGARLSSNIDLNDIFRQKYPKSRFTKEGSVNIWDDMIHAIALICNVDYNAVATLYSIIPDYRYIEEDKHRSPTRWGK